MTAAVSVVVSTFQRAHLLPRLVAALEAQTLPRERFEVVICDDGSDDGTAEVLASLARRSAVPLRVLTSTVNCGPAAGRERGWRAARAPVIAFTDDDCQPEPGWLAAGLAELDRLQAAVVVGRTVPDPEQVHLMVDFHRTLRVDDARFAQTCNVFYRRADLEAVDGFDLLMRTCGEDVDLALRVEAAGSPRVFAPDAVVRHDVRPSSLKARLRETPRWTDVPRVYAKHPQARREHLTMRVFWKPTHPPLVLLVVGALAALARRSPGPLVLGLPWVRFRTAVWPLARGPRRRWALLPGALCIDALETAVMLRGSVRHRTVVL